MKLEIELDTQGSTLDEQRKDAIKEFKKGYFNLTICDDEKQIGKCQQVYIK